MNQRLLFVLSLSCSVLVTAIAPTFATPTTESSQESLLEFKVGGCKDDRWSFDHPLPREATLPFSALQAISQLSRETNRQLNGSIAHNSQPTPTCQLKAAKLAHSTSHFVEIRQDDRVFNLAFNGAATDVKVETNNRKIAFSHKLRYLCCADITLKSQVENNTIAITEINQGSGCRCGCDYLVEASVGPLAPGTYQLQVYGVRNDNRTRVEQNPAETPLLFERTVTVP